MVDPFITAPAINMANLNSRMPRFEQIQAEMLKGVRIEFLETLIK
jgi:hypothetical protein